MSTSLNSDHSRHVTRHVHHAPTISQRRIDFEHKRPRLLRECAAEAAGVFFYVFSGIAAICAFTLATVNPLGPELGVATFGGVPWIGVAFGFGIAFAIICFGATSGGHFNPAGQFICLSTDSSDHFKLPSAS